MKYVLLLIGFCCLGKVQSQEPETHGLGVHFGFAVLNNQDLLASPFRFNGTAPTLGLTYWRQHGKSFQDAAVRFSSFTLDTEITGTLGPDSHTAASTTLQFFYNYRPAIWQTEKWRVYAGGGVRTDLTLREYDYGRGIANETIGEVSTSLMASGALTYRPAERWALSFTSGISLLNFSFRNPYSLTTDALADVATKKSIPGAYLDQGEWTSLGEVMYWTNELNLTLLSAKKITVQGEYRFDVNQFTQPRKSFSLVNSLAANVLYQF